MRYAALVVAVSCLAYISCTAGSSPSLQPGDSGPQPNTDSAIPVTLPQDSVQPWEAADAAGLVIPRSASAINPNSEYYYGAQEWDRSITALDSGDVMELDSSADTCWALYRLPLGGPQPGAVSVDANLNQHSSGGISEYWVGIADYAKGGWDWRGPFTDAHTRICTGSPSASLVSPVGSLFVCVVTDGGSRIDVVGVGANPADPADTDAPPQVTGLNLDPHDGALELNWNNVVAADLAGYRVYYRDANFIDGYTPGVNTLPCLIGNTTCMLPGAGTTYVRVAAVDIAGNEGPVSEIVSADIPVGAPPQLIVTVSNPSVLVNDAVEATATGADFYDWDIDGDGVFDFVGDASGVKSIYTGSAGIIRPLVRGTSGGTAVAHNAVSVIVAGNARPVVQASVDTAFGTAPLTVNFSSVQIDFDGTIAERVWNFLGDTHVSWRLSTAGGAENPPQYNYTTPGLYNSRVKVWDDDGAWDVDSVAVNVWQTLPPSADITVDDDEFYLDALVGYEVTFDASGSYDPAGGMLTYAFDPLGNGDWQDNGANPLYPRTYGPEQRGLHQAAVRVTNSQGVSDTAVVAVSAWGFVPTTSPGTTAQGRIRINELGGYPYLFWPNELGTANMGAFIQAYPDSAGSAPGHSMYALEYNPGDSRNSVGMCVGADPAYLNLAWYNNDSNKFYVGNYNIGSTMISWLVPPGLVAGEGVMVDMETVENQPAVAYYKSSTTQLVYRRCTGVKATSGWGSALIIATASVMNDLDLEIVDGRPALLYQATADRNLYYAIADDATGSTWAAPITADSHASNIGYFCDLALINGNPALVGLNQTDANIRYSRSTSADGSQEADWITDAVITLPDGFAPRNCVALLEVNGMPNIVAVGTKSDNHSRIYLISAANPEGSAWNDPVVIYSAPGRYYKYMSVMLMNGHPMFACQPTDNGVQLFYPRL